jgi:hypothetical protein
MPWTLTKVGGIALAGLSRPDIAFRTKSTDYHPRIRSARRRVASAQTALRHAPGSRRPASSLSDKAPVVPESTEVTMRGASVVRPTQEKVADSEPARTADVKNRPEPNHGAATLRSRLGGHTLTRPTFTDTSDDKRAANQRIALVVVGALAIVLALMGVARAFPQSGTSSTVDVGKTVRGPHWEYSVETVARAEQLSSATPRGVFLIVWVTATKRDASAPALLARDFALLDADGRQYAPLTESDAVYRSDGNPGSPLIWRTSYALGDPVSTPVVFDVRPALRGLQLIILEVPAVRVRLD